MFKFFKMFNFVIYTILCIGVSYYAFTFLLQEINPKNLFQVKMALAGWVTPMHFYAAGLALLLTPLQLSKKIRQSSKSIHRSIGLLYVICVAFGGISGLLMAIDADGGWVAKLGFGSLAILWLLTTGLAFFYALKGQISAHKRWIYRSVALTAAGITLRLFLGVGLGVLQLPFLTVYVPTSWLCWTINLMICEIILYRRHQHQQLALQL